MYWPCRDLVCEVAHTATNFLHEMGRLPRFALNFAIEGEADMANGDRVVRFWHLADVPNATANARFWG